MRGQFTEYANRALDQAQKGQRSMGQATLVQSICCWVC